MNGWEQSWEGAIGLSPSTHEVWVAAIAILLMFIAVILPALAVLSYLGRKLSADLQARVGPNRSGPAGIFQPIADMLKLLQKDGSEATSRIEVFWLGFQTMALYSTLAVLPFGSLFLIVDTDMSVFVAFWASLLLAMGTLLMGLDQKSVPGWLGGLRIASQATAAALPALFAILSAGIRSGGFRWSDFADAQGAWLPGWTAFSSPFEFFAFVVFIVSGLILLSAPPLDGGLTSRDLHGGISAHITGRRLVLQRLSRLYGFFLWSVMAVVLFLGGWNLPEGIVEAFGGAEASGALQALELGVLLAKAFALVIGVVLLGNVTPRLRSDQVTDFAWRVLSPFGVICLAGTAIWIGWIGRSGF